MVSMENVMSVLGKEFPSPYLLNKGNKLIIRTVHVAYRGFIERGIYRQTGQPSLRIIDERRMELLSITLPIYDLQLPPDCCVINECERPGLEFALIVAGVVEMTKDSVVMGTSEYPIAKIIMH